MTAVPGATAMPGLYWWGPATFFGCATSDDPAATEIGLIGVPHSLGGLTTERDQHLAPRAVRHVSGFYRRVHRDYGFDVWDTHSVNDLGDTPIPHLAVGDRAVQDIQQFFEAVVATGTRPVSVGGDHSVTAPILRALCSDASPFEKGIALIQVDAHLDTYEGLGDWFGIENSCATWAASVVREGTVDPQRSVQVGRRGHFSPMAQGNVPDLGYHRIDKDDVDQLGIDGTVQRIVEVVGDAPVYITFDLDTFDVSVAPAVSAPEATEGGFAIKDATALLRGLRALNVIGADVVEYMPTKDNPNHVTGLVASMIMFEELYLIANALQTTAPR
jgi:guanidinopropionase